MQPDRAALYIGAIALIHRLCSSLNEHVRFYVFGCLRFEEAVVDWYWTSGKLVVAADCCQRSPTDKKLAFSFG